MSGQSNPDFISRGSFWPWHAELAMRNGIMMRQPVQWVLKTAILGTGAPLCHFEILSLNESECIDDE